MKAVSLTFLFRVGQTLGSVAMVWLTAVWMGPIMRGQTSWLNTLVQAAVLLSGYGAGSGMLYAASRARHEDLRNWLTVSSVAAALLLGVMGWLSGGWGTYDEPLIWVLGLLVISFLQSWLSGQRALALGIGRLDWDRWTGTASTVFPALGLGLCYGLDFNPSLGLYLLVLALALLLVTALLAIQKRGVASQFPEEISHDDLVPQRELWGLLWSKNRWTATANAAQFLVYRLQYVVLFMGLGEATLGLYSVAVVGAETLWLITQSFSTVLLARWSAHRGEPTEVMVQQSWKASLQALAWTLIAVVGLLSVPDPWITSVLGAEYAVLGRWWWFMAPGILALSWSNVMIHHFTALGKVRVSFYSSVLSALFTVLGLAYALRLQGVVGVASWWSLVLVLNAVAVGGYFLNTYRSYLWPPSESRP
ncbi:MAG: lipopolysaccharide biosynthesis protein [Bacteroidia bacterium]